MESKSCFRCCNSLTATTPEVPSIVSPHPSSPQTQVEPGNNQQSHLDHQEFRRRVQTTPERPKAFSESQVANSNASTTSQRHHLGKQFSSPPVPQYSSSPVSPGYYNPAPSSHGGSILQSPHSFSPHVSAPTSNWRAEGGGGGGWYDREISVLSNVSVNDENEKQYIQEQQERFQQIEERMGKSTGVCVCVCEVLHCLMQPCPSTVFKCVALSFHV